MKKLILVGVLLSGLVFWSPARAITPTTATIDCSAPFGTSQGPFNFSGQVGESFTLVNSGASQCTLAQMAGVVTPSGAGYRVGAFGPEIMIGGTATFTIVAAGSFTATTVLGTGDVVTINVTLGGGGGASGPATLVTSSLDANGGSCLFGGTVRSKYDSTTIGYSYAPGNDECARSQCVLVGWNVSSSATTPVPANLPLLKVDDTLAKRAFVAKSGDFVADWVQAPKFDSIVLKLGEFTKLTWDSECRGLVQFDASGSCSFSGSSSVKVSGEVTIIADRGAGACVVTAKPVFTAYQNLDGTLPRATPPPTLPSSTFTVTVEVPPSERSIAIIGSRGTADVSLPSDETCRSYAEGPPPRTLPVGCVVVEGIATGYPAGTPVTPEYRFPGQTSYTAGIDVTINDDGEFTWYRKTGKKIYVRFLIGDVVSNRVIIPAK